MPIIANSGSNALEPRPADSKFILPTKALSV